MTEQEKQEIHLCPGCGASNNEEELIKREYRCQQCNLELAHLDVAANGVIRGIFGWLRSEGDLVEERYRIKSLLGKGGFGATYLVEDVRLSGKRRALKEVPALMFDEYETTLLSRLNHPSIPDIIDRIETNGMIYLVLEFGGNHTLGGERKQYPGQRIPQETLLPWMQQLCDVLIYLHAQTPPIVHRDLKPDNVLLDENGRIMLIDFGIAKESAPATMTRTLGRAATHGFSPPEQAMGTGTDERSDIYALAATFYALLTGENPPAAHERVAGKELIAPSQFVQDIAPQVEATILQALNLNVNRRQQTVQEFIEALAEVDGINSAQALGNTNNSNRTVLLGKTSHTTAMHPPSIKLPSARITTASHTTSAKTDASQQASKRNAIILGVGISSLLLILTAGYFLWPNEEKESQEPSQIVNAPPDNPPPVTEVEKQSDSPIQANNVTPPTVSPAVSTPQSTSVQTNVNQKNTSATANTSAIDALKEQWEKNNVNTPPEPAPEPVVQKQAVTQIKSIPEPPKPRPRTKPKPKPKVEPSNNDWLSDFQGSMTRTK